MRPLCVVIALVLLASTAAHAGQDFFTIDGTIFASEPTGSGGTPSPSIAITRTSTTGAIGAASVEYTTIATSATAGSDYVAATGTITWQGTEQGSKFITIQINPDLINEGDETFKIMLQNPSNGTVFPGAGESCTVTILDAAYIGVASTSVSINESSSTLNVTVNRLGAAEGGVSCNYSTANGSATAGADYTAVSGTLSWGPSDFSQRTVSIPILNDSTGEAAETFAMGLSNFQISPGRPGGFQATSTNVTIFDDDSSMLWSSATYSGSEGSTVALTVLRNGSTLGSLAVDYTTQDGTATGADYIAASGTLFFNDGEVSKLLTLTLNPDGQVESTENFSVTLSNPRRILGIGAVTLGATITTTVSITDGIGIVELNPNQAAAGGAALNVTVSGANFVSGATVQWNGQPRPTTFVSATQLTVQIPASDFATGGKATVSVENPGNIDSNTLPFFVYTGSIGTWIVTTSADSGTGSLREALDAVRSGDTVLFDSSVFDLANSDAATIINLSSPLPELLSGGVTIDAQDRRVTVNGSGAGSAFGLSIPSNNNVVRGLTLLGFSKSGVLLKGGATGNLLGGNRNTGLGPNGQGLRISDNGAFGIEFDGAGTTANSVKGCRIGLDASGGEAQPNLAGILIHNGAAQNVIGGTSDGEGNLIGGNDFEGITVSDANSDGNVFVGNTIGTPETDTDTTTATLSRDKIPTRAALGNGSAGLFISKGTRNSRLGGKQTGESNKVEGNGGSGVEVRTTTSVQNRVQGNRIARNAKGGIALFDGSNNGIRAPNISKVERIPTRAANDGAASRTSAKVQVAGTADRDGDVELFVDPDGQGGRFVTRVVVVGGVFDTEVEIDVEDLLQVTATLSDGDGNTSIFSAFRGVQTDSDGDGVSDMLETAGGTDPADGSSVPVSQGVLAVDKLSLGLNFATPTKDHLKATLRLAAPDSYTLPNTKIGILINAYGETVTLDAKGRSPKQPVSISAKKSKTGPGVLLTVSIKGQNLQSKLTSLGLLNETTDSAGVMVDLPVAVVLNNGSAAYAYAGTVSILYKATADKSGKAASVKQK